jgi:DNA-binding GntR family transcriptional regulator
MIVDLTSRSALIALMYQSAHSAAESHREHVAIVDALERRDARAAVRLSTTHLENVELNVRLDPRSPGLAAILAPHAAAAPRSST